MQRYARTRGPAAAVVAVCLLSGGACVDFEEKKFPSIACQPPGAKQYCLLRKGQSDGVFIGCSPDGSGQTTYGPCSCKGDVTEEGYPCEENPCRDGWLETSQGACSLLCPDCCPVGSMPAREGNCVATGPQCPVQWTRKATGGCAVDLDEARCGYSDVVLIGGGCHTTGPECVDAFVENKEQGGCRPKLSKDNPDLQEFDEACGRNQVLRMSSQSCVDVGHIRLDDEEEGCGQQGPWGLAPRQTGGEVWYVWAGYLSADADGSRDRPFSTIQAAVDAAYVGDTIVIGARDTGEVYGEAVTVGKFLNIEGRCPQLVGLEPPADPGGNQSASLLLAGLQTGTDEKGHPEQTARISGISLSGQGHGIVVEGVRLSPTDVSEEDVVIIKNVSVAGTTDAGILIHDSSHVLITRATVSQSGELEGAGGIRVDDSQEIEVKSCATTDNHGAGVWVDDSYHVYVYQTLVRDTRYHEHTQSGSGVHIVGYSQARIEECNIIGSSGQGVYAHASTTMIGNSFIRDTQLDPEGEGGAGVAIRGGSEATIGSCAIERSARVGIDVVNSRLFFDGGLLRDTNPEGNAASDASIRISSGSEVDITSATMVEHTRDGVVLSADSILTMDSTLLKMNGGPSDGVVRRALHVGDSSKANIDSCAILKHAQEGIRVNTSELTLHRSLVKDLATGTTREAPGIFIDQGSEVQVTDSSVVNNIKTGVLMWASTATIESSLVGHTRPLQSGRFGIGIDLGNVSRLTLKGSVVIDNYQTGINVLNSILMMDTSQVADTKPSPDGSGGEGINIVGGGPEAEVTMSSCTISNNHGHGVLLVNSPAVLSDCAITGTNRTADGFWGTGIRAEQDATLTLERTLLRDNYGAGVAIVSATGRLTNNWIEQVYPSRTYWLLDGDMVEPPWPAADGVALIEALDVMVESNLIAGCRRVAAVFDHASGTFDNNIISDNLFGFESRQSPAAQHGDNNLYLNNDFDPPHSPGQYGLGY